MKFNQCINDQLIIENDLLITDIKKSYSLLNIKTQTYYPIDGIPINITNKQVHVLTSHNGLRFMQIKPEDYECCICLEKIKQKHALIPCGHTNTCPKCIKSVKKCPICQAHITSSMKIFL